MIRLISLDAWNTLLKLDLITSSISGELGRISGLSGEAALRTMIDVYREVKGRWLSGLIEDPMIVREACEALARRLHLKADQVSDAIRAAFDSIDPHELVYPEVWGVLEDLSREFELAVVSNVFYWPGSFTRKVIEGSGISRFLTIQLYADELGISKPDRRVFARLCGVLGVSAEEAAHVGDELMEDVGGAISSGMKAILIKRNAARPLVIRELGLAITPSLSSLREILAELDPRPET